MKKGNFKVKSDIVFNKLVHYKFYKEMKLYRFIALVEFIIILALLVNLMGYIL